MQERINNVETLLKKRLHKSKQGKIHVREIVATQVKDSYPPGASGEFAKESGVSKKDLEALKKKEITRLVQYVEQIASRAVQIHIESNYINPQNYLSPKALRVQAEERAKKLSPNIPTEEEIQSQEEAILAEKEQACMKPDKLDDVTRISLNEFALYPHKNLGPLSLEEFNTLLSQLDKLASNYPQNLHLALGSIPVVDQYNEVHSMGVYVQCSGERPIINSFAKAIIDANDPLYPSTTNPNFSTRMPPMDWSFEIYKTTSAILQEFNNGNLNAIAEHINHFKKIIDIYKNIKPSPELLKIVQTIEIEIKKNPSPSQKLYSHIGTFQNQVNQFLKAITNVRQNEVNHIAAASLPESTEGAALFQSGNIVCETAGGTSFHVSIDLCLSNKYGVAKSRLSQDIQLAKQKGEVTYPDKASYLLLSNTIALNQENVISESVTHNDPKAKAVMESNKPLKMERKEEITKPIFGPKVTLDIYPPRELRTHTTSFQHEMNTHHDFLIKLDALRLDRAQHLSNQVKYDQRIIAHVVTPVLLSLDKLGDEFSSFKSKLKSSHLDYDDAIKLLNEIQDKLQNSQRTQDITVSLQNAKSLLESEKIDSLSHQKTFDLSCETKLKNQLIEEISNLENRKQDVPSSTLSPSLSENNQQISHSCPQITLFEQGNMLSTCESKYISQGVNSNDHKPETSASISLSPPNVNSFLTLFGFLGYISPFSFSWNKPQKVSMADLRKLEELIHLTKELNETFNSLKKKRAYRSGVNKGLYDQVEYLFSKTIGDTKTILKDMKSTPVSFNSVEATILKIQKSLPQLTNKHIEKELRYEEIRQRRKNKK